MRAPFLALTVEQGALWNQHLEWRAPAAAGEPPESGDAINITGWHARMQVRRRLNDDAVLVELTDANGRIALGAVAGTLDLELLATVTKDLPVGRHVYDLELVPPSGETDVVRLVEGTFSVRAEVTR